MRRMGVGECVQNGHILEKCAKGLENEPHLNSDYYAGLDPSHGAHLVFTINGKLQLCQPLDTGVKDADMHTPKERTQICGA